MTPGRAAFEKWLELVPPGPFLRWGDLPKVGKEGWEEIAKAGIVEYLRTQPNERFIRRGEPTQTP